MATKKTTTTNTKPTSTAPSSLNIKDDGMVKDPVKSSTTLNNRTTSLSTSSANKGNVATAAPKATGTPANLATSLGLKEGASQSSIDAALKRRNISLEQANQMVSSGQTISRPTPGQAAIDNATSGIQKNQTNTPEGMTPDVGAQVENASLNIASAAEAVGKSLQAGLGELQKQLQLAGEANKIAFDKMVASLGDGASAFQKQLQDIQTASGKMVDLTNAGLQKELETAAERGVSDLKPILEKYLGQDLPKGARPSNAGDDVAQLDNLINQAKTLGVDEKLISSAESSKGLDAAIFPNVIRSLQEAIASQEQSNSLPNQNADGSFSQNDDGPGAAETTLSNGIMNVNKMDVNTLLNNFSTLDFENMTPAELLQATLKMNLGVIGGQDAASQEYFDKMTKYAKSGYEEAKALARTEASEIDRAIDGRNFAPTTFAGLTAKAASQAAEFGEEAIDLEKKYRQEQFDIEMEREREKRGRLDGYLKAKLYAMGAQDSAAGLSLMSMQVDAADLRLQQATSENNFAMSQLNLEQRQIKANFANQIAQINIEAQSRISTSQSEMNDKLFQIEGLKLETQQEKEKLILNTITDFANKSNEVKQQEAAARQKALEFSYQQTKDKIDESYKLAGLTGTRWIINSSGQLEDTGDPTFESKKWQDQYSLDIAQYEHTVKNASLTNMVSMLKASADYEFNDSARAVLESMASGLNLDGVTTSAGAIAAVEQYQAEALQGMYYANETISTANQEVIKSADGKIQPAGLKVNPLLIADIREQLSQPGITQTQGFSLPSSGKGTDGDGGHRGIDYVITGHNGAKMGAGVEAVRGGTVIDIIPWDGTENGMGAFGNTVRIKDDSGMVWQYGHLGNKEGGKGGKGSFNVSIGDRVEKGGVIGFQGNTGRTKGVTGVHVDLRLVGYDSQADQTGLNRSTNMISPSIFSGNTKAGAAGSGLGLDQIQKSPVAKVADDAYRLASRLKLSQAAQERFDSTLAFDIQSGKGTAIANTLKSSVVDALPDADSRKKFTAFQNAINTGDALLRAHREYVAKTGKQTGVLIGSAENVLAKLGSTQDPELAKLRNTYAQAASRYLNEISGASATENEFIRVSGQLPSIKDTIAVTEAKLQSFKDSANTQISSTYKQVLGEDAAKNLYLGLFRASNLQDKEDGIVTGTIGINGKNTTVIFDVKEGKSYRKDASGKLIPLTFK